MARSSRSCCAGDSGDQAQERDKGAPSAPPPSAGLRDIQGDGRPASGRGALAVADAPEKLPLTRNEHQFSERNSGSRGEGPHFPSAASPPRSLSPAGTSGWSCGLCASPSRASGVCPSPREGAGGRRVPPTAVGAAQGAGGAEPGFPAHGGGGSDQRASSRSEGSLSAVALPVGARTFKRKYTFPEAPGVCPQQTQREGARGLAAGGRAAAGGCESGPAAPSRSAGAGLC